MGPVTISILKPSPSRDPLVVSFPCGLPVPSDGPSFGLHPLSETVERTRLTAGDPALTRSCLTAGDYTVHGSDGSRTYTSTRETSSGDAIRRPATRILVGVLDRAAGTLVIRHAAGGGGPRVARAHVLRPLEKPPCGDEATDIKSAYDNLYKSFGSSKKQRVLKAQAENTVTVNKVVGGEGMLGAMGDGMGLPVGGDSTEDTKQTNPAIDKSIEESRRDFLPPYDQDATDPSKVYRMEDMAGKEAWAVIQKRVNFVLKCHRENKIKWMDALMGKGSRWPVCLTDLLKTIDLDAKREAGTDRLRTIILVLHMIRFNEMCGGNKKKSLRGSVRSLGEDSGVPDEVLRRLLSLFSEDKNTGELGGSPEDPDEKFTVMWDRRLTERRHVFALIAYASAAGGGDMKVGDISVVMKDLAIDGVTARKILSQAGFVSKINAGKSITAVLKVPLTFPSLNRKR